jgi:hypothetical protein
VPMLREHALELLDGEASAPAPEGDLTCKAAGGIIGRHDSTVRGMCERGEFPGAYRQNGREWRIPRGALTAYQATQRTGKTAGKTAVRTRPVDLGSWRKERAG